MLAAQFTGEERLFLRELPVPACPEDGVLVRVSACAICGTDIKTLRQADVKLEGGKMRQMSLPRILGHEFAGVIAACGPAVSGFRVGERVVVAPTVPCGECHYCRRGIGEMCEQVNVFGYDWDGGFSEMVRVEGAVLRSGCLIPIPDGVDDRHACIAEPISCALNCLELTPVTPGDIVAIIGAGPLGVILTNLAKLHGARTVILAERSAEQIAAARVSQADVLVHTGSEDLHAAVDAITGGRGVDVLIIACSAPAAQLGALRLIAKRGKINLFAGLPRGDSTVCWDTNIIHYTECSVTGTHGSRPEHVRAALELLASGALDGSTIVSCTYPLREINAALDHSRGAGRLKVVITM